MIVMISPAKTMKASKSGDMKVTQPRLLHHTQMLLEVLRGYTASELERLMKMNTKLGVQNYERYQLMDLSQPGYPAVFFYDGIQYKSMQLASLTEEELGYLSDTLRIISGMYGVLRPLDGIWPYRLEMQQKGIQIKEANDLYELWAGPVQECLLEDLNAQMKNGRNTERILVNLASNEYSKLVADWVGENKVKYISCTFKVNKSGVLKVESTASKKARGQMVRFIAQQKAETIEDLMKFAVDGYSYCEELSKCEKDDMIELVFVKTVQ